VRRCRQDPLALEPEVGLAGGVALLAYAVPKYMVECDPPHRSVIRITILRDGASWRFPVTDFAKVGKSMVGGPGA